MPPGRTLQKLEREASAGVPTPRCEVLGGGRLQCSLGARLDPSCRGRAGLPSPPGRCHGAALQVSLGLLEREAKSPLSFGGEAGPSE